MKRKQKASPNSNQLISAKFQMLKMPLNQKNVWMYDQKKLKMGGKNERIKLKLLTIWTNDGQDENKIDDHGERRIKRNWQLKCSELWVLLNTIKQLLAIDSLDISVPLPFLDSMYYTISVSFRAHISHLYRLSWFWLRLAHFLVSAKLCALGTETLRSHSSAPPAISFYGVWIKSAWIH